MTTIIVKSPSCWFVNVPASDDNPASWVNLAMVTTVTEVLSCDGNDISLKILMSDGSTLVLTGKDQVMSILQELDNLSRVRS